MLSNLPRRLLSTPARVCPRSPCFRTVALALALGTAASAYAQSVQSTITVGQGPWSVNVNPVSNKIYVANVLGNSVSVIDGTTNRIASVPVGISPWGVAVNPVTNKIYTADGAGTVTVIDGATNTTTTITGIPSPQGVVVNPITNKIYVLCPLSNTVKVIDGATNAVTGTVPTGTYPTTLALNPDTDKIYVANTGLQGQGNTVTIIDGSTNATSTATVGNNPVAIAINPATNKIYVVNSVTNTVSVIDGVTNATTSVPVGTNPIAIALDVVTNRIYVANLLSNTVTQIDGATNASKTVPVGASPIGVEVDETTGQVYVANFGAGTTASTVTVLDEAKGTTTSLSVGAGPEAIGINPLTNKVYVCNRGIFQVGQIGSTVTVLDGATDQTATLPAGTSPYAIALNAVTNRLYVANSGDNTVSVIDAGTHALLATVPTGNRPSSIVANPVTNKVYAANSFGGGITVIDGATNAAATIASSSSPSAIALNPVTNKIYGLEGSFIVVVDGASGSFVTVPAAGGTGPSNPNAIAVNPVTNKIYAANLVMDSVTVLDGATNAISAVPAGHAPYAVAINTVTNKIYVPNYFSGTVTVIDGATNGATTLNADSLATELAVNPLTNTIYVTNSWGNDITVINGSTNSASTLTGFSGPITIAVDPLLNLVYVGNSGTNTVSVLDGVTNTILSNINVGAFPYGMVVNPFNSIAYAMSGFSDVSAIVPNAIQPIPLATAIQPVVDANTISLTNVFQTGTSSPRFTVSVNSNYTTANPSNSTNPLPTAVYYQVDGGSGPWLPAQVTSAGSNPAGFAVQLSNIPLGLHVLYVFAAYGNETGLSSSSNSNGSSNKVGNIASCYFLVVSSTAALNVRLVVAPEPSTYGQPFTATATFTSVAESNVPTGTATFTLDGGSPTPGILNSAGIATASFPSASAGSHSVTVSYPGDVNFSATSATVTHVVTALSTVTGLTCSPTTIATNGTSLLTATVTSSGGTPSGSIAFTDNGTALATQTLLNGTSGLNYTGTGVVAGTHTLTATYIPTGSFNASSASCSVTVNTLATTSVLTGTPVTSNYGSPVTLTAAVSPVASPGPSTPAGVVTFYDGGAAIAVVTLDAFGHAAFTASTLAVGIHSITAVYAGNTIYSASTSTAILETVRALPKDFTITLASPAITVKTQHHLTTSLTLASLNNFADTLALVCANLPAYLTCQPTPNHAPLAAGGSATVSLYLDTDSVLGYAHNRPTPPGTRVSPISLALLLSPLSFLTGLTTIRRRTRLHVLFFVLVLIPAFAALAGCGDIVIPYDVPPSVAPGTYIIPISATGAATGITHTANLTLTVTH